MGVEDLPLEIQNNHYEQNDGQTFSDFELAAMEKRHISRVLEYTKGNKTETARLLKIGLTTLYRKIEEYNIYLINKILQYCVHLWHIFGI